MSRRQRKREQFAQQCDQHFGLNNTASREVRAVNRRIDKEKDFSGEPKADGSWRWKQDPRTWDE